MTGQDSTPKQALVSERLEFLRVLESWLETPMLVLAFVWLALFIIEQTRGLSPVLEVTGYVIWAIFLLNFVVEFTVAPHKFDYLKKNWLTAVSLLAPALRVFRIARVLRAARAARGLRLLRVISSLNRGMRALGAAMSRRGFGYVIALTLVVTLAGAAGMYAFENGTPGGRGLYTYGAALWWTAMIMTTMGSEYWPQTAEGRVLCLVLALYAFAVFGYVTATLATFFIGRDAENSAAELAGAESVEALRAELAALRDDVRALSRRNTER